MWSFLSLQNKTALQVDRKETIKPLTVLFVHPKFVPAKSEVEVVVGVGE